MIKLFLCFHPVFYLYQSEDKMRMIASQLLSSLYYLHFDRILHRDIKPQKNTIDKWWHYQAVWFWLCKVHGSEHTHVNICQGNPTLHGHRDHRKKNLWSQCFFYCSESSLCLIYSVVYWKTGFWVVFCTNYITTFSHHSFTTANL